MTDAAPQIPPEPASQRETCNRLYRATLPFVWATLRRGGITSKHDREDIAHDVFIAAYRRIDTYDPSKSPEGWIAGFTWRTLSNYRRTIRRRREQLAMDIDLESLTDRTLTAEEQIEATEREQALQRALATIPLKRRMVLVMKELQGLSIDEVADAMQLSRATACRYLKSAKESLEKAIQRMSQKDREALGVPAFMLAPITMADLDRMFAESRAAIPPEPPADVRDRIWARLCEHMAALPPSPDEAPISGTRPILDPKRILANLTAAKGPGLLVLAFLGGGAAKTALDHVLQSQEPARIEVTAAHDTPPAPLNSAAGALTGSSAPASSAAGTTSSTSAPAAASPSTPQAMPSTTTSATAATDAKAETALAMRARRLLRSGQANGALAVTEEHARAFPSSSYAAEIASIRIEALAAFGQRARAEQERAQFRARFPRSVLLKDIDRALQSTSAPR